MINGTIGVRFARNCHPDDLWTKYFTSSVNVMEYRWLYGEPDVIEIRQTFNDSIQAREWEHKVLRRMKVVKSEQWLNKTDCYGPPPAPGEYNPFYGKTHSVETKIVIGLQSKGRKQTEEFREKQRKRFTGKGNPFYGLCRNGSENPMYGRTHSVETRLKMKLKKQKNPPIGANNPMYGKKQPTDVCQYCGKIASKTNIRRWHGQNCKEKNNVND